MHVVSLSFFKRATGTTDLAQVRYTRTTESGDDTTEHTTHWIANIEFAYAKPSSDVEMRQRNPLGLRILAFRTEQEVPGENTRAPGGAPVRTGGVP